MEYFDIVDENGLPTGETIERTEAHAIGARHRTAHIWITRKVNGRVQVLLQLRAKNKDSFPGRYDTSSAGHIQAGDEPLDSACRELAEELGIHADPSELSFMGNARFCYEKEFYGKPFRDNEVVFLYQYEKDVDIHSLVLQPEELDGAAWFDLDEVVEAVDTYDQRFCVPPEGILVLMHHLGIDDRGKLKNRRRS